MWMPALASANSGTITKLVHGCRRCWRRSLGEIAEATAELRRAGERGRRLLAERARLLGHALEVDARRRVGARDQPDREPGDHAGRCRTSAAPPRRATPTTAATRRRHSARGEAQREQRQEQPGGHRERDDRRRARCRRWRSRSAPRGRRRPPASAGARAAASRRGASSPSAPSANAVSVDIAAPQPVAPAPPALNARKIATGTAMPPSAAATGIRSGAARAAGPGRARAWPRARRRGSRTSSGPR